MLSSRTGPERRQKMRLDSPAHGVIPRRKFSARRSLTSRREASRQGMRSPPRPPRFYKASAFRQPSMNRQAGIPRPAILRISPFPASCPALLNRDGDERQRPAPDNDNTDWDAGNDSRILAVHPIIRGRSRISTCDLMQIRSHPFFARHPTVSYVFSRTPPICFRLQTTFGSP